MMLRTEQTNTNDNPLKNTKVAFHTIEHNPSERLQLNTVHGK